LNQPDNALLESENNMVVGETLELVVVAAMIIISMLLMIFIQKATGGIDEDE
jgi:hypothetical protein